MMPTGTTQAAATGAAASFPFSPDAATGKAPKAADAFGKLLIATIGDTQPATSDAKQAKSTTDAAGDAQNATAVADAWFNALTIDFATLNAALDKEEGTSET